MPLEYDTGALVAEYWPFFGEWAANSQYGYVMAWFKSEADAVAYAKAYYSKRPHLEARMVEA